MHPSPIIWSEVFSDRVAVVDSFLKLHAEIGTVFIYHQVCWSQLTHEKDFPALIAIHGQLVGLMPQERNLGSPFVAGCRGEFNAFYRMIDRVFQPVWSSNRCCL